MKKYEKEFLILVYTIFCAKFNIMPKMKSYFLYSSFEIETLY